MTLTCHARGLPVPTFTWILPDGSPVNATKSVYEIEIPETRGAKLQEDGSLLVFNTHVRNTGIYKCVAINVMGKDERSVNLTVREGEISYDTAFCYVVRSILLRNKLNPS